MRAFSYLILGIICIVGMYSPIHAQVRTHLGINAPALTMGTLDIQGEMVLAPRMSLFMGSGLRFDNRREGDPSALNIFRNYKHQRERAMSLAMGLRLFDESASYYQYPYMTFSLIGVYYDDTYQLLDQMGNLTTERVQGFKLGGTAHIGICVIITDYITLDIAAQLGYIRPRDDIPPFIPYYFPGMGFSTFGLGVLGVKGGHIQPILSLRYNIVRDKRQRIHDRDK